MIRVWRGDWVKSRAPHTLTLKTLGVFDSDQTDFKLDSAAITTKPTTCNPTRKLIPIYLQKHQPKFEAFFQYQKVPPFRSILGAASLNCNI